MVEQAVAYVRKETGGSRRGTTFFPETNSAFMWEQARPGETSDQSRPEQTRPAV